MASQTATSFSRKFLQKSTLQETFLKFNRLYYWDYLGNWINIVVPISDGSFHNGLLFAELLDGTRTYYNNKGNKAFTLPTHIKPLTDFFDQRAIVIDTTTNLVGYINTKGVLVIPCQYYEASSFSEGVAYVATAKSDAGVLIDRAGNIVNHLPEKYSSEYSFNEGMARAYGIGKIGFINTLGELVIPYEYDFARGFSDGLVLVQNSKGMYGYIDKTGKTVIPFKYKSGGDYTEGLMPVQNTKGKWGYMDHKGKTVIPFQYENAYGFSEGLAIVFNASGKIGFINKKGNLVIGYQKYTRAFDFKEGIALVGIGTNSDGKFGYIDRKGNLLTKLEYRSESSSFNDGYALAVKAQGTGFILTKNLLSK